MKFLIKKIFIGMIIIFLLSSCGKNENLEEITNDETSYISNETTSKVEQSDLEDIRTTLNDHLVLLSDLERRLTLVEDEIDAMNAILESSYIPSEHNRELYTDTETSSDYYNSSSNEPIHNLISTSSTFKERYRAILEEEFEQRNYMNAIQEFEALRFSQSNCDLADNCYYWIGECLYQLGENQEAIIQFQKLLYIYPTTNKIPDANYMMGLCYMRLNNYDTATDYFHKVAQYNDSPLVPRAKALINRLTDSLAEKGIE